jgi:hypothetical protein
MLHFRNLSECSFKKSLKAGEEVPLKPPARVNIYMDWGYVMRGAQSVFFLRVLKPLGTVFKV